MSVKEGYKMTELGEIPEGWDVHKLEECTNRITDGSHFSPIPVEISNYKICTVANMKKSRLDLKNSANISEEDYIKLVKGDCAAKFGDILLSKDGTVGKTLLFSQDEENIVFLSSIAIMTPNKNILLSEYLNQYLQDSKTLERLSNTKTGSAIKRIVLKDIKNSRIIIPPIKEQEKIASILSTVDEQIGNVDALIDKNKELKKGLMQTLLTKGIGHTKFKKTELGEIPEEWEVKSIANIADTTSGGTPSRAKKEYYENGIYPWIKTGELNKKYISVTEEYITEDALKKSSAKLVPINTVIIAMYGATIGKLSIAKKDVTTNQACCSIICNDSICYNEYLYYRLDFKKESIINLGAGGAQPNISQDIVKNYKIALPSVEEQKKIASILSEVDNKIDEYEDKKQRLKELKKGLMQQLLTGKIRIKT